MPVYVSSNALCEQNINLYQADKIINFCIDQLTKLDNQFATIFLANFNNRIVQRRNITSSSLVAFLNSKSTKDIHLEYLSRGEVVESAKSLYGKLKLDNIQIVEPQLQESDNEEFSEFDAEAQMVKSLKKALVEQSESRISDMDIDEKLDLLCLGPINDVDIETMSNAMLTIQPTSVNPERVFSLAGFLCTKLRNKMGSDLLDALVFLKYNFKNYL